MTLNKLRDAAYGNAKDKGFHSGPLNIPEKIALIHNEASEALEEYREWPDPTHICREEGKPQGFPIEIADVIIRCLDLCGALGINIEGAVEEKMSYNQVRPYLHGGKKC